jgi:protein-disulfide isomerase-like protein with CxxC motif
MHENGKCVSLTDIQQGSDIEEEMGYDAPFVTFTWEHWQEIQARTLQNFSRFQRAIDQRQSRLALLIVMEMQAMSTEMQKEACAWIGVPEK